MHRWAAWHLHLPTLDPRAQDQVVVDVVGPAVNWLRARDEAAEWFFVRYWQHGPHIRFRVAGLGSDLVRQMDQLLRAVMIVPQPEERLTVAAYRSHVAPLAAAGEGGGTIAVGVLWPAGVYRQPYVPEPDRYGGKDLLRVSESLFVSSSELVLAFASRRPPPGARAGLALQATAAAVQVLPEEDQRLGFCQRSGAGWRAWAGLDDDRRPVVAVTDELAGRIRAPSTTGPVRRWVDGLAPAFRAWRDAGPDGLAERILHSHIHMLHNRLGLSIAHELAHYQTIAHVLTPRKVPVGS